MKIFTLFDISPSFLSEIHYVLISIKYRSVFIIATKKKQLKINNLKGEIYGHFNMIILK